ncbi:hypothetical protein GI582_14370 [Sulfitobacter sp. BDSS02]|nr:hypothetical protein [Sulfitobacter sp. BDSS02]MBR9850135.1 hypothetical protein [Paracoccaceae bacterium]
MSQTEHDEHETRDVGAGSAIKATADRLKQQEEEAGNDTSRERDPKAAPSTVSEAQQTGSRPSSPSSDKTAGQQPGGDAQAKDPTPV